MLIPTSICTSVLVFFPGMMIIHFVMVSAQYISMLVTFMIVQPLSLIRLFLFSTGAFLIPYLLMVVFLGLPMFLLEVTIGQYSSFGSIMVWEASPLFKGKMVLFS